MYLLFFVLWIIFNGRVTLEIVIFGLAIAAAVYAFMCRFMDFSPRKDKLILKKSGLIIRYVVVLIREIIKANYASIRLFISPRIQNEPVIIRFKSGLRTKTARVVLANSITLTPGTITVSLEEDEYVVHCLDRSFSHGIGDSVFVKLLRKMEEPDE